MNLKGAVRTGHGVEHGLQPLDVRLLLDRVDEALIPKSGARNRFSHLKISYAGFALNARQTGWPAWT